MSDTEARVNDDGVVVLGPELTIPFATLWRDSLRDAVALRDGHLRVDLGQVTDFDSAGVQLLLATARSLAARGHALVVVAASTAVRDALTVFGLTALLPDAAPQE
jgi:anti-sigma B factor antagonist